MDVFVYCVKPIQAKSLKAQILSFVQQLQPLKVLSNEFSTNISAVPGASLPLQSRAQYLDRLDGSISLTLELVLEPDLSSPF